MKILTREKFSWPFLNLLDNFFSKMLFINSKNTYQSLGSKYFLRMDLEASLHFSYYRLETNWRCFNNSKNSFENYTQNQRNHVYFGLRKIPCGLFSSKGIFSVFGDLEKIQKQIRNQHTKIKQELLKKTGQ
jgi:hypothetical protein